MIDKKISLGTLLTLGTIVGTFIYTQGVFATKMETYENENAPVTVDLTLRYDNCVLQY